MFTDEISENLEPEIQEEQTEISLEAMREGKVQFSKLSKEEKIRLTREAREQLEDEEMKEAWDMGWRSQEFFGGKAKDGSSREFIDHKTFLEKISNNVPIQNERIRTLRERESQKDKELEEMRREVKKANELAKMNFERSLKNDEQILDAQIREAKEYGDFDRYDALNLKKQELIEGRLKLKEYEPEIEQIPTIDPQIQTDLENWGAKNIWYYSDLEMQNYAKQQAEILNKNYPNIPFKDRLDKITELTKAFFPERFPQQPSKPLVLSSRNAGTFSSNKKTELTFSQLPDIEKDQARKMIRTGVFKDENDFMKSYNQIIKK